MKRTKFIWFALGAATSGILSIAASHLISEDASHLNPYLSVSERNLTPEESSQLQEVAQTSGRLLRECGAKQFYMKAANGSDGVPYSLIKIDQSNDLAIHCVFERARGEGFPLHIQMITDQNAQTD